MAKMVWKIWKGDERWIFTTSEFINLEAEIEYILVFTSG